jgi:hypothetical protein
LPLKPHLGQRTDAKKRPQRGQLAAAIDTSAPQLSQKKRGFLLPIAAFMHH